MMRNALVNSAASKPPLPPNASTSNASPSAAPEAHGLIYLRDDEVDPDDDFDAFPLAASSEVPPLPMVLADVVLGARPVQVYEALFKRSSAFRTRIYDKEGAESIQTSRWTPDQELAAVSGFPGAKTRVITSTRPQKIPLPGVPARMMFRDKQALLAKSSEGFVVETHTQMHAPGKWAVWTDKLSTRTQWAAKSEGPDVMRVRLTFKIEVSHDTGSFIQSTVSGPVFVNSSHRLKMWVDALLAEFPVAQPPAPAPDAPAAPPGPSARARLSGLLGSVASSVVKVVHSVDPRLLVVGVLVLAVAYMSSCLAALATALGELAAVMDSSSSGSSSSGDSSSGDGDVGMGTGAGKAAEFGGRGAELTLRVLRMLAEAGDKGA